MRHETELDVLTAKAGSNLALAAALGVTKQAVSLWRKRGSIPPAQFEQATALYNIDWSDPLTFEKPEPTTIFEALINAAGGRRALAEELGVTEQAVGQWHKRGWMPIQRARQTAEIYNLDWTTLVKPELLDHINAAH